MTDDEKLNGFIDRELDRSAHARVDALTQEPAAAALLSRLRGNDDFVRAAFDAPMHEGVPDRFAAVIEAGLASTDRARANHVDGSAPMNDNQPRWWHLGGAVAASLAVGLMLGTQLLAPVGGASSSPALSEALDATASLQTVTLASGERLTPDLTFAQAGGGYCRQFRLAVANRGHAGVACRTNGQWAVEALMPAVAVSSAADAYVTAEGAAPSSLDSVIDTLRGGDPLDGAAERALIANGWR